MFERFTDRARTAVILARTTASERGDQIRPVYMLHALASGDGVAARSREHRGPQERQDAGDARSAASRFSSNAYPVDRFI